MGGSHSHRLEAVSHGVKGLFFLFVSGYIVLYELYGLQMVWIADGRLQMYALISTGVY